MPTKTLTRRGSFVITDFKAVGDPSNGEFEALVSVFNNVDLVGDRVLPGAFKATLAAWKASGDPIPVIWSHDWNDPFAHIGVVSDAVETADGLKIRGKNDIGKPFAKQVHDLLVARRVKEFSFAYDIIREARAKDGANDLIELGLIEVGPTLKGCNTETQLIAAKAFDDAHQKGSNVTELSALSGRKVYLDAEIPGSFDETQQSIRTAAQALLNPSEDPDVYVWVQATFPDYAIVQICRQGEDDENYQIPWSFDGDDAVTLGDPVAVEVTATIAPKARAEQKAGRTISQATASALKAITDQLKAAHDDYVAEYAKAMSALSALADSATADDGKHLEQPTDDPTGADREPQAKSPDESVLRARTRIEEMRATK